MALLAAEAPLKRQLVGELELLYPLSGAAVDSLSLGARFKMPYGLKVGMDVGWSGLSGLRIAESKLALDWSASLMRNTVKMMTSIKPFWLDVDSLRRNLEADGQFKVLMGRRTIWGLGASVRYRRELWTKGATNLSANSLGLGVFVSLER
jgi:hypothetical protein